MSIQTRTFQIELATRKENTEGAAKVFTAVLSSETPVTRRTWDGSFDEVLSHKSSAVNLERAPLPLIESHNHRSLPIGIVDHLRIEGGKLRGDITFGKSARAREIEADVEGGIIRNLSVGYSVEATTEAKDGDKRTITATRWTPHEVSAVAVPADKTAGFNRSATMPENENQDTDLSTRAALNERNRVSGILRLGNALQLDQTIVQRHIADGTDEAAFRAAALDAIETRAKLDPIRTDGPRVSVLGPAAVDDFRAAAVDALLLRSGVQVSKPHAAARDVNASVQDLARVCLSRAGKTVQGQSKELLIRGAMSTSDFPLILADAMHKSVRKGYEEEPSSHRAWVRAVSVPDFKDQRRPILGSAPDLDLLAEHAEYKNGDLGEDGATYRISKYGKIVSLTWEALVNDDLNAFFRVKPAMGMAARRKEADVIYALFAENAAAGPTMQDGVVLFHATHGNLASAGAMDGATLGAARTLLRKQKALGGGFMALVPKFLILPAELEQAAEMLLASSTRFVSSTQEANAPTWIGNLIPVVEPRLPANAFYLAADAGQIDHCELGLLDENFSGPTITEEQEFRKDNYSWKVKHVFGGKFLDWRGIVKVPVS